MATQRASGSQAATLDTEHSLATRTDNKEYVLHVDLSVLANADIVILRAKTKVLTGSAAKIQVLGIFANVQAQPNVSSIPVAAAHSVEFTLEQTDGAARTFDWSVVSLD